MNSYNKKKTKINLYNYLQIKVLINWAEKKGNEINNRNSNCSLFRIKTTRILRISFI